jgi:hypothetical protein
MVTNKQRLTLNQDTMRKTVILLMTLTLVVMSIGAATAKGKPDKPDKPSSDLVYYNVTMDLVNNSDGLSTDATCGDAPLVMRLEESRNGSLLATADGAFPSDPKTSEPDLYMEAGFAELVDRCWYGTNPLSTESNADFFRMVFDRDGALEKITWHFDVVMDGATVTQKYALTSQNKKGRNSVAVEWAGNLDGGPSTGVVTGSFELWDYTNTDDPVWELIDTRELEFTLTIANS